MNTTMIILIQIRLDDQISSDSLNKQIIVKEKNKKKDSPTNSINFLIGYFFPNALSIEFSMKNNSISFYNRYIS